MVLSACLCRVVGYCQAKLHEFIKWVSSVNPCTSLVRWPRLVGLRLLPERRQLGSPAARIVSLPRLQRWPGLSFMHLIRPPQWFHGNVLSQHSHCLSKSLSQPLCFPRHRPVISCSCLRHEVRGSLPLSSRQGPTRSATSLIFHGSHYTLRGTIIR